MRATAVSFLLILTTALRLAAGPHPCTEGPQPVHPAQKTPAAHAGCHGQEAGSEARTAPAPGQKSRNGGSPNKAADHTICQKACQALAVLHAAPVLSASRLSRELPALSAERAVPLFVLSIDHIPLA